MTTCGESKQEREAIAKESSIGPVEKGPAFGFIAPEAAPSDKAWPSYRHDERRTGATANHIGGSLKRTWVSEAPVCREIWRSRSPPRSRSASTAPISRSRASGVAPVRSRLRLPAS